MFYNILVGRKALIVIDMYFYFLAVYVIGSYVFPRVSCPKTYLNVGWET